MNAAVIDDCRLIANRIANIFIIQTKLERAMKFSTQILMVLALSLIFERGMFNKQLRRRAFSSSQRESRTLSGCLLLDDSMFTMRLAHSLPP